MSHSHDIHTGGFTFNSSDHSATIDFQVFGNEENVPLDIRYVTPVRFEVFAHSAGLSGSHASVAWPGGSYEMVSLFGNPSVRANVGAGVGTIDLRHVIEFTVTPDLPGVAGILEDLFWSEVAKRGIQTEFKRVVDTFASGDISPLCGVLNNVSLDTISAAIGAGDIPLVDAEFSCHVTAVGQLFVERSASVTTSGQFRINARSSAGGAGGNGMADIEVDLPHVLPITVANFPSDPSVISIQLDGNPPSFLAAPLSGDFNYNGLLDIRDIDILAVAIRTRSNSESYDLLEDGGVNRDDLRFWVEQLANTRLGDLNLDGSVDAHDAAILFGNWGSLGGNWSEGNLLGGSRIDARDAAILFENWTGDVVGVPEPSAVAFVLTLIITASGNRGGRRHSQWPAPQAIEPG